MTTVMLVGATGLVGGASLRQAQSDARVARIVAPTRRELRLIRNSKTRCSISSTCRPMLRGGPSMG
jgi:uncharacterized protein YbjT (DUF2867 family)